MFDPEDLLRNSHNNSRPVSPPDGQWERIQSALQQKTSSVLPFGFFSGIGVGLLLGLLPWLMIHRGSEGEDCGRRPVDGVAPAAAPMVDNVTRDTVMVTTYDTIKFDTPLDSKIEKRTYAAIRPLYPLTNPINYTNFEYRSVSTGQFSVPLSKGEGLVINELSEANLFDTVASLYRQKAFDELSIRGFKPRPNELEPIETSLGWKGFTRVDKTDQPAGRWEFGIHFTPHLTGGNDYNGTFFGPQNSTSDISQTFDLDGKEQTLFRQSGGGIKTAVRPRLLITHLELGRQWSEGIRAGIGFGIYSEVDRGPADNEILPYLSEGEYYLHSIKDYETLYATASIGYTIRRRKRLQVHLGAMVSGTFRQDDRKIQYLYSRNDRRDYNVAYTERVRGNYFYYFRVLPQLDIQYHLNDRLSLGLELMPGVGIGGRYKFYKP